MELLVESSVEAGCRLAARVVARQVRAKPEAVLGLATGRTQVLFYRELVRMAREEELDLRRVTSFNLDEYVGLGPEDEGSFHAFMEEHFFGPLGLDRSRVHLPDGCAPDLQAECLAYERRIAAAGGIDLQVLGLGRNGHIGFNEPTGSLGSRTWVKVLSEETLHANAADFGGAAHVPRHALSMGVGTILEARHVLLLAFGAEKAHAVAAMVEGPVTSLCPASALQLHPRVTVVLDEVAAAELQQLGHYRWVEANRLPWQRYE